MQISGKFSKFQNRRVRLHGLDTLRYHLPCGLATVSGYPAIFPIAPVRVGKFCLARCGTAIGVPPAQAPNASNLRGNSAPIQMAYSR